MKQTFRKISLVAMLSLFFCVGSAYLAQATTCDMSFAVWLSASEQLQSGDMSFTTAACDPPCRFIHGTSCSAEDEFMYCNSAYRWCDPGVDYICTCYGSPRTWKCTP